MTMQDHSSSRRSIPRPWLSENYRGGKAGSDLEVWDKPRWSISWDKLSSCFCLKDQRNNNQFRSSYPEEPFAPIHVGGSCSYSSGDMDSHDGSFSSVTSAGDSDSSTYYSSDDNSTANENRHRRNQRDSSQVQNQANAKQPSWRSSMSNATPPPPKGKPPRAGRRLKHLPPLAASSPRAPSPLLGSISSIGTPKGRHRCDTGEFSKTSATTNTSRHRRSEQFDFSTRSIENIWRKEDKITMPPPFVLCQASSPRISMTLSEADDSGYFSPLDDSDDDDDDVDENNNNTNYEPQLPNTKAVMQDSLLLLLQDDDEEDDSHSPFAELERKIAQEEVIIEQKPPFMSSKPPRQPEPGPFIPEYLRRSPLIDEGSYHNQVNLAGWMAVSFGDDSLEARLNRKSKLTVNDIYYVRIVEHDLHSFLILHPAHNQAQVITYKLTTDLVCESREISSRIGRCVVVRKHYGPPLVTLLPVSLGDCFFENEELVSAKRFARLHSHLFAQGRGRVYAPDEQHHSAMHIMFSLDALIKGSRR